MLTNQVEGRTFLPFAISPISVQTKINYLLFSVLPASRSCLFDPTNLNHLLILNSLNLAEHL